MEGSRNKCLLKLVSKHHRDLALVSLDVANNIKEVAEEVVNIGKSLVNEREKRSKLMKLGLACLAFPEPVVSNIIGSTLLTLGYYVEKARKGSTLRDMLEAIRELKNILTATYI